MKIFDITQYGAVGDGKTLNTVAIQRAIDECAMVGGGRVLISSGIYMSGSITLSSNVDLHINYSNKTQNVKITVKDGYSISTVFGSEIKDGTLEIGANDAALYKMEIG